MDHFLLGTEGDTVRSCFSSEVSGIKRQRLDFTEVYKQKITGLLLEKYGFKTKEASSRHFNKMFVEPLIHEQGKSTKEKQKSKEALGTFSATEESIDSINLSQLFERNSLSNTNVILLVGMPGTGKTILTHWICYEWASGGFSHFKLTFLFEFRQLNLISKSVSLRELLFNLFLMPDANSEEVYQYILEHPQYVLILFDGLDEFVGQISHDSSKINPDPNCAVSISQLFSSLLHGMVLCGCTVVVTCRSKILNSIPISSVDIVAEVLGFNQEKVEEYVKCFFPSEELKAKSLFYLKENHKLMHMCFVPALCHIVCMCLEHLLHSSLSPTQLPQTITQFYIKMLSIFLWKEHKSSATEKTMLKTFRPLISELCNLALKGLDERKTVFYVKDISEDLKGFAPRHGLLSVFDVKKIEGSTDLGYSFVHLSSQEFFAALYLMISRTVTETELYKKLSLKSKWNLKYKTKEEFTENVHIFLSGLSSKECQSFLNELTEHSMGLVQKKQQTIIKCLVKLAKTQLTGPKLIELCHCTYETQDLDLAQRVGKQLELKYYFKNFRISPADMTALSFVINQGTCSVCLDFAGCPMEPDCLDILGKCENLQSLSFRNRKYGDSFAQALSKCLAGRKTLQTIRLTGGRLTSIGVAALTQSYLSCPQLQEIIMQDNRLKLEDMVMCLEVFSKMKQLKKIDLSNNEINMKSALALSKVAAKCPSITDVQISGDSNTVIFLSASLTQPSLENCSLTSEEVPQLVHILKDLSPLTDVNLSGNALEDRGCKELVNSLPDIHISGKLRCLQQTAALYFLVDKAVEHREISLSGNKISLDEVIALAESFSSIENMTDVTIRHGTFLIANKDQAASPGISKTFSLTECLITRRKLRKLFLALERCPALTQINLSNNSLSYQMIENVLKYLPVFPNLTFLNISKNDFSPNCVLLLADSINLCNRIKEVDIRSTETMCLHLEKQHKATEVVCSLSHNRLGDAGIKVLADLLVSLTSLKTIVLESVNMTHIGMIHITESLRHCRSIQNINFSHNDIGETGAIALANVLPQKRNLQIINVSHCFSVTCDGGRRFILELSKIPELQEIYLDSVNLDDAALLTLSQGLLQVPSIKALICPRCSRPGRRRSSYRMGPVRPSTKGRRWTQSYNEPPSPKGWHLTPPRSLERDQKSLFRSRSAYVGATNELLKELPATTPPNGRTTSQPTDEVPSTSEELSPLVNKVVLQAVVGKKLAAGEAYLEPDDQNLLAARPLCRPALPKTPLAEGGRKTCFIKDCALFNVVKRLTCLFNSAMKGSPNKRPLADGPNSLEPKSASLASILKVMTLTWDLAIGFRTKFRKGPCLRGLPALLVDSAGTYSARLKSPRTQLKVMTLTWDLAIGFRTKFRKGPCLRGLPALLVDSAGTYSARLKSPRTQLKVMTLTWDLAIGFRTKFRKGPCLRGLPALLVDSAGTYSARLKSPRTQLKVMTLTWDLAIGFRTKFRKGPCLRGLPALLVGSAGTYSARLKSPRTQLKVMTLTWDLAIGFRTKFRKGPCLRGLPALLVGSAGTYSARLKSPRTQLKVMTLTWDLAIGFRTKFRKGPCLRGLPALLVGSAGTYSARLKSPRTQPSKLGDSHEGYQPCRLGSHLVHLGDTESLDPGGGKVFCPSFLSCSVLNDFGAERLSEVLPSMKNLRKLNLSRTNIGPAGGIKLAEALGSCGILEELFLAVSHFEDETAMCIGF
ncbi:protein NLRC5 [Rhinophrynus dorsalis]